MAEPAVQEALGQLPQQAGEAGVGVALSRMLQQWWKGLVRVALSPTPHQKWKAGMAEGLGCAAWDEQQACPWWQGNP